MLSTLLVLLWMSRYRCAPKISLVNEVLVGLEWRGLIGQHNHPCWPHRKNEISIKLGMDEASNSDSDLLNLAKSDSPLPDKVLSGNQHAM